MANPNISILGATYSGVSGVTLPKSGGGTATFPWVEGSKEITQNGTVDVTNLASVIVNVAGGGGDSPWTLIDEQTVSVSTTSTSPAAVATITNSVLSTKDKIVWVHIRDLNGKRSGYFYGSDAYFMNYYKANGSTQTILTPAVLCIRVTTAGAYGATAGQYGVYGYSISNAGELTVRRRYNSSYTLTIDGNFKISTYTLDLPSGLYLFD